MKPPLPPLRRAALTAGSAVTYPAPGIATPFSYPADLVLSSLAENLLCFSASCLLLPPDDKVPVLGAHHCVLRPGPDTLIVGAQ